MERKTNKKVRIVTANREKTHGYLLWEKRREIQTENGETRERMKTPNRIKRKTKRKTELEIQTPGQTSKKTVDGEKDTDTQKNRKGNDIILLSFLV